MPFGGRPPQQKQNRSVRIVAQRTLSLIIDVEGASLAKTMPRTSRRHRIRILLRSFGVQNEMNALRKPTENSDIRCCRSSPEQQRVSDALLIPRSSCPELKFFSHSRPIVSRRRLPFWIRRREFKLKAVKLVRERGVSVAQAARDLDVHKSVLRKWVKKYGAYPTQAFPGHAQMKAEQAAP
ncbi:hypothetical protein CO676_34000 [Sinorhizobium sp. BJ1]|nr:hypothetical protein CO676_34000 [Sinorhizobium sp. BJ1]